jgi:hypothetical protein
MPSISHSTPYFNLLPIGNHSKIKKYSSEKATTKGTRTQKRKRYNGSQTMPTGGAGTGRKGAIDVPIELLLAKYLLFRGVTKVTDGKNRQMVVVEKTS